MKFNYIKKNNVKILQYKKKLFEKIFFFFKIYCKIDINN